MTLDLLSDSFLSQLAKYSHSKPYREYPTNRPYVAISTRLNKPSSNALHQLINDQKNPLTLNRSNYKLRIKSDLNVDLLRETPRHGHSHTHSNITEPLYATSGSGTTKMFVRQPTSVTRTTNSKKTIRTEEFTGIEGNAVRVGTLSDLIKHFDREQIRLIHQPTEYLDNISTYTATNRLHNERPAPKTSPFPLERMIKQPQALTEYRFHAPKSPHTSYRNRLKEKRLNNNNPDLPQLTDEYSTKRQSTARTSHDKRIQESREKSLLHTEKQLCICNKLTIIDPFNSEQKQSTSPPVGYFFPPVRPFGYLTKKSLDDSPQLAPSLPRKKRPTKKLARSSLESIDQISTNADEDSLLLSDTTKSMTTITDPDDIDNPPNTRINLKLKH